MSKDRRLEPAFEDLPLVLARCRLKLPFYTLDSFLIQKIIAFYIGKHPGYILSHAHLMYFIEKIPILALYAVEYRQIKM